VTIRATAGKVRAGDLGEEKPAPLRDYIEFGVDDRRRQPAGARTPPGDRAAQQPHAGGRRPPARAGIDPDNKLIDRKPTDNMMSVDIP
jgi:ABC-2 type transport system permease protein